MSTLFRLRLGLLVHTILFVVALTLWGVQHSWRRIHELEHRLTSSHLETFPLAENLKQKLLSLNYLATDSERELFKQLNDAFDQYLAATRQVHASRQPTPYTASSPHPRSPTGEVNATNYLNLVRDDWLRRPTPVEELGLLAFTGVASALVLLRRLPGRAAFLAAALATTLAAVGYVLPWLAGGWFPWIIIVAIQVLVAFGCSFIAGLQHINDRWPELHLALGAPKFAPEQAQSASPESPAVAVSPAASELVTAQVLEQMKRLRGTSGMSPGSLQELWPPGTLGPPALPDHELIRPIGKGGYGEVWLARNVLGGYRAAKIIYRKTFAEDRPYEREFEGIRRFEPISRSHPGLVQILHVGRDDAVGYYYCLMELADDLRGENSIDPESYVPKTLGRLAQQLGTVPAGECLRIGLGLTNALEYLHGQGLVHRDIKPSNIIFVRNEPKLADIGLVTDIGGGRTFVGTAGYLPPEGPGSPSSDLYSLGKVLYEVSTGLESARFPELPTAFNAGEAASGLSALNDIIVKACATDPGRRYASARQMHEDLQKAADRKRGWFRR